MLLSPGDDSLQLFEWHLPWHAVERAGNAYERDALAIAKVWLDAFDDAGLRAFLAVERNVAAAGDVSRDDRAHYGLPISTVKPLDRACSTYSLNASSMAFSGRSSSYQNFTLPEPRRYFRRALMR